MLNRHSFGAQVPARLPYNGLNCFLGLGQGLLKKGSYPRALIKRRGRGRD